jgi:hypothetical protein
MARASLFKVDWSTRAAKLRIVSSLAPGWQPNCAARKLRRLIGSRQVERDSALGLIGGSEKSAKDRFCLPNPRGSIRGIAAGACPARDTFAPLRTKGPVLKFQPPYGASRKHVCKKSLSFIRGINVGPSRAFPEHEGRGPATSELTSKCDRLNRVPHQPPHHGTTTCQQPCRKHREALREIRFAAYRSSVVSPAKLLVWFSACAFVRQWPQKKISPRHNLTLPHRRDLFLDPKHALSTLP